MLYSLHQPTEINATGSYVLNLPKGGTIYTLSLTSTTPTTTALPIGSNTIVLSETPCFVLASG